MNPALKLPFNPALTHLAESSSGYHKISDAKAHLVSINCWIIFFFFFAGLDMTWILLLTRFWHVCLRAAVLHDPRRRHRFLQKSSRAGCGDRSPYRSGERGDAHRRPAVGSNQQTFAQKHGIKNAGTYLKRLSPNSFCQETNASGATPSRTLACFLCSWTL